MISSFSSDVASLKTRFRIYEPLLAELKENGIFWTERVEEVGAD
jgi:hypothetical protein